MTDRELVGVFWGVCAAVPLIWGIATLVRLGVDQQEREDRAENSPTAPEAADSPRATDSPLANGGKPF